MFSDIVNDDYGNDELQMEEYRDDDGNNERRHYCSRMDISSLTKSGIIYWGAIIVSHGRAALH